MTYKDWVKGQELHYSKHPGGAPDFRLPIVLGWLRNCNRVLDCGIHTGSMTTRLAEGQEIVGLDLPRVLHTHGSWKFPVVGADTTYLPFKDQTFDGVWAGEIIEHLWFPKLFFFDVHRVLTSKGLLAVSTPEGQGASMRHSTHCKWFDEDKLRDITEPLFKTLEVSRPKRDCLMMLL